MALVKDENGKRILDTASSRVFREDYRKQRLISYAEAADYAGVSISSITKWVSGKIPRICLARRTGPYRIDLLELDKFLRRGCKK